MDEMMRYIFSNLRNSESVIRNTLREQRAFKRSVKFFAAMITLNTIALKIENSKMSNEIETLKSEIKDLKNIREV
ncbi:MAG: hypothetical protein K2H01_06025 [Ruminococcus sp.]|nr:hypothetical protein [Ruminococcus sp.]